MTALVIAALLACADPAAEGAAEGPPDPAGPPTATTCADPSAREEAVYDVHVLGEEWETVPEHGAPEWLMLEGGRGISLADLDGDGILDLFVPRFGFASKLLRGLGDGTFEDITAEAIEGLAIAGYFGSSAADIDGDDDLDLFVWGMDAPGTLLVNDGSGRFTAYEQQHWDIGDTNGYGCGAAGAWADYDRDGDLDLFYGRGGAVDPFTGEVFTCSSALLRNDGEKMEIVADLLPEQIHRQRVVSGGWDDFDGDGWLDLYVTSDRLPSPNLLLLNDTEGGFTLVRDTGLEIVVLSMGLALGDLNDDGLADVTVPDIGGLPTLLSEPGLGLWVAHDDTLGLVPDEGRHQEVAWGGEYADLDNDGHEDVVITYGDVRPHDVERDQPDEIYRGTGAGFEAVGAAWGFDQVEVMRGVAVGDLDGDGYLDLVKRELGGVVYVHVSRCGDAGWLEVRLHDEVNPNHRAIGARVTVTTAAGTQSRRIYAGSTSYNSSGPPVAHFGLGSASEVTEVTVEWPTGEVTRHGPFAPGQVVEIRRP